MTDQQISREYGDREQMIERLSEYWANEIDDMGIGELKQLCHELMVENLRRRNTSDLARELAEIA